MISRVCYLTSLSTVLLFSSERGKAEIIRRRDFFHFSPLAEDPKGREIGLINVKTESLQEPHRV